MEIKGKPRAPKKRAYSAGAIIRTRLFTEGLLLLRLMAQRPVSRHDAGAELKIHPRRWYRWLKTFERCEIPLAVDDRAIRLRAARGPRTEKTYRLWPQDWARLIHPEAPARRHSTTEQRNPSKTKILKTMKEALNRVLK